jgi:hypothetical protein
MARVAQQTATMERIPPKRRRGRRRGERQVAVLGTQDLFELLGCSDIDALLARLKDLGDQELRQRLRRTKARQRSDYNLPEEMRERAREIADASSGWVGK